MWKYNLVKYILEQIKLTSQLIKERSGHIGIIYKSKLMIFDWRYFNNTSSVDVDIYNIDTNKWTLGQLNTSIFLKLRRNHIACLVGTANVYQCWIKFGEYLDDACLLNLSNL